MGAALNLWHSLDLEMILSSTLLDMSRLRCPSCSAPPFYLPLLGFLCGILCFAFRWVWVDFLYSSSNSNPLIAFLISIPSCFLTIESQCDWGWQHSWPRTWHHCATLQPGWSVIKCGLAQFGMSLFPYPFLPPHIRSMDEMGWSFSGHQRLRGD